MMETLNAVWTALTTTNEELINILLIPCNFIEITLTMLFFTTILNIDTTKKQKAIYILTFGLLSILSNWIIPDPFNVILNIIAYPLLVLIIFKTSILKAILSELLPIVIGAILETILLKLYDLILGVSQLQAYTIPIYRLSFMIINYSFIAILYLLCKKYNFNITILDTMNKKTKRLLIANSVLMLLSFVLQALLISFYIDNLPIPITIISMLTLLGYYGISIYSLTKTTKLEITTRDLEQSKQYNKTLTILHDNIRCFRHDFNNIVTTIGGYVHSEDMSGLKSYYSQLVKDCQKSNNLSALNPEVINEPAIYSLLTNKYHLATELGITVNVESFIDFNSLNIKIYDFTKVLGILLDNAIEASKECDEKTINIFIRKDISANRQLLIIENSYKEKNVDIDKIFDKGFTNKPNNTGLGLWEVRQILKRNNNLNLFTTKNKDYFRQQFEIYC